MSVSRFGLARRAAFRGALAAGWTPDDAGLRRGDFAAAPFAAARFAGAFFGAARFAAAGFAVAAFVPVPERLPRAGAVRDGDFFAGALRTFVAGADAVAVRFVPRSAAAVFARVRPVADAVVDFDARAGRFVARFVAGVAGPAALRDATRVLGVVKCCNPSGSGRAVAARKTV